MFRFEHSYYLYALGLLPLLAILFFLYWRWRKGAISRFGQASLMTQLMPGVSKWKHPIKFGLMLLALTLLIVGWANPQWGTKREKAKRKSVDVFIALDISNSMLAEDVPPNRLERAKRFGEDLVEKLKTERIGLILFAGGAYLQMPITTDYAAAQIFLRSASTDLAGSQGTAIGDAIAVARRSFSEDESKAHKALIVITDGEDHDGDAVEQATEAREEGMLLFTVGVGTAEGGFIPVNLGARQDYKRDESGEPVRSRINEKMLADLAGTGGGNYFNISQGDKVAEALKKRIDQMEKQELEVRAFTEFNSYFQYLLAAAFVLLLVEFLISYRKNERLEGRDIFS